MLRSNSTITAALKDDFLLIGPVQNNKTANEFFNDFQKHDTKGDWAYGFSDDELREYMTTARQL